MRYRPIGTDPDDPRLGRLIPDDMEHVERYPLTAIGPQSITRPTPIVIGVNWYEAFDRPIRDTQGRYWVGRDGNLGRIRGGHCVCLEPGGPPYDLAGWYEFYDQGREGKCVGAGWSRCMSILNRVRYPMAWLWDRAKERDQWPDTNPGDDNGTSVRAGGDVLRHLGHVKWTREYADDNHHQRAGYRPDLQHGIRVFRWATSVDDMHTVLGNPIADRLGALPFLNSWGVDYPRRVWMPDGVIERLRREQGEFAVPTDR